MKKDPMQNWILAAMPALLSILMAILITGCSF